MAQLHEKPMKASKVLRMRAQEFLSSRKYANNLVEIMQHFESGADPSACLLTVDMVFGGLLRSGQMYLETVPLELMAKDTPENQYRKWLQAHYEDALQRVLTCFETNPSSRIQCQALATAMNLLAAEGKHPLSSIKGNATQGVPLGRLSTIVSRLLVVTENAPALINKLDEYLQYNDVLYSVWRLLPKLTTKGNPTETYILNYLSLLEHMPLKLHDTKKLLIYDESDLFTHDEELPRTNLNKIWRCVMLWEHTLATHKHLLILLLERVLPELDRPLLLTDFLMDSLDAGGPVSLLALQGIFTLIQVYNLEYPNIYGKLYSMFEPEIFHTKFKARLFYLADLFLTSTHLSETLVAAFAKRLARLALIAPASDTIVICLFIGNLIRRHAGLKCLLNYDRDNVQASQDPYVMEECDPHKSGAIQSSLWEVQTLQQHVLPSVAQAAKFINEPVGGTEADIGPLLENDSNDLFDREVRRNRKFLATAFERPLSGGHMKSGDVLATYWHF